MKILGFAQGGHDSSYAILEDGVIVIHEELERINRIKETNEDILEFYVNNRGSLDEFDHVVTFLHADTRWYPPKFITGMESNDPRFKIVGHHVSHAANAFYSSNFDKALIFSIDGGGWDYLERQRIPPNPGCVDGVAYGPHPGTFTVWIGEGNKIHHLMYMMEPNIGGLWDGTTKGIFGLSGAGPPFGSQAGTVMGMAAHGTPEKYSGLPSFPYLHHSPVIVTEQDRFDFAAAFQKWTEDTIRTLMEPFIKGTGIKKICVTGGVALNCVANGKLQEWFDLEEVYVPPVPYDAGLAMGTAQYLYHHILGHPKSMDASYKTPYLGSKYELKDVMSALEKIESDKTEVRYATKEDVCNLLNEQKIVSLYGGRSESGRRALGNRSIIADPRHIEMKDYINQRTKHRQWFRPFAPSILREHVTDWFVRDIDSPYMNFAIPFKDEVKHLVPVVVHADGTGRLQTVTEEMNPHYHALLTTWYQKTGVPILVNTSFNDREPIVETPSHAIDCFLRTDIDYLYFFDYNLLVKKS